MDGDFPNPMDDALTRMTDLAAAWGAADQRSIFADSYALMTRNVLSAIDAGEFADAPWVSSLLARFAGYYFDAVDLYEADVRQCPRPWRLAFDWSRNRELHPLRALFLGINTHINYDLAQALADAMSDWPTMSDELRGKRLRDHIAVNAVIERTVDVVQAEVVHPVAPEMGVVDVILGPIDEWFFSALIGRWRAAVWDDAVNILEADPDERAAVLGSIEDRCIEIADRVLHVGPG